MIAAIIDNRCVDCGECAAVCPTNVFDFAPECGPIIARLDDCQTCFLCELHCPTDALYVDPDCETAVEVDLAAIEASGLLGKFKRDSGWGEWDGDPRYPNEHWRMDGIFKRAAALAAQHTSLTGRPPAPVPQIHGKPDA